MPDDKKTVSFDRAKLVRFKAAYKETCEKKLEEFTFEGDTYFVGYAKYLIEYLEGQFKGSNG